MAKIMIQGTASSVGKSILVTALCRIFKQDGYKVTPYKSQNMSLNSYITLDGKEMGRAQVLQAYAAGIQPEVYMNPILLKPTTDKTCQVIVKGKVYCNCNAIEYHSMKPGFENMLKKDFQEMEEQFDIVVVEGAGSPAEINLRDRDIVNMGLAEMVDAPVLLVGDIDKGGVFASLAGTMILLSDSEKERVKGTIINKFRGDIEILKPGLSMLEDIINIPSFGVVPYFKFNLEDEDGAIEFNKEITSAIDIAVIKLPHISNFTDIDALKIEEDVSLRYITSAEEFGEPDLLILPGTKNTIGDLIYLRNSGLEKVVKNYAEEGMVIGVCGGYQMLGKLIEDPYEVETYEKSIEGMNLLNIKTAFEKEKVVARIKGKSLDESMDIYGYEIHMGICEYEKGTKPLIKITNKNGEKVDYYDGAVNNRGNIMGTYIHGIFDGTEFREYIVNILREKKGIKKKKSVSYENIREEQLDNLAEIVRRSLDINKIYEIMKLKV